MFDGAKFSQSYESNKPMKFKRANRKQFNDDQRGQVGMLFLADAVIHGDQFNSSNFVADFGCSNEELAEFHKELEETKSCSVNIKNVLEVAVSC